MFTSARREAAARSPTDFGSSMELPHAPSSVGLARRRLSDELAEHHVSRTTVDDAALVLSEILSNALKHARPLESGHVEVSWDVLLDGTVCLAVTDGGSTTRPVVGRPSVSALGGRGLGIVAALASEWGVDGPVPGTTTVWARLR
ncbi:MAG TPA: ATP-binding protein [Actinomycetes bacterium]|nr:ATP-binding protein [Actinomycetes bacterium]HJY26091.1 ATP-binding protein [Actinomycetes bacterium]